MSIESINYPISYKHFYDFFLKNNKPCILSSKFTNSWTSRKTWFKNGKLDLSMMKKLFGDATVPVVDCDKRFHTSHANSEKTMEEFLKYWENRNSQIYYLKDWHCQRDFKHLKIYEVPEYFQSDWLNEYWDAREDCMDDYRFVYIGVKNSWTPFHADVFFSYSWSANICGLKKWLLFPPGTENLLKDKYGNLPFNMETFIKDSENNITVKPLILYQHEGEVLFVPSGWYHQVFNEKDTVSVNHNWVNATSIMSMFSYITGELDKVKFEIRDCIDMDGYLDQCQLILNANVGIDFTHFSDMLIFLAEKRLNILSVETDNIESFQKLIASVFITEVPNDHSHLPKCSIDEYKDFLQFDLQKIKEVLLLLLDHPDASYVLSKTLLSKGNLLIGKIDKLLS